MEDSGMLREMLPMKISNWESIKYSEGICCPNPECDNDGYYDDVLPSDAGKLGEEIDTGLIKKVAAVIGVMLLIIVLCVVAMYLL